MSERRGIQVFNRQRGVRFDLQWLRRFAAAALGEFEARGLAAGHPLAMLPEVEVSVLSDGAIASIHLRFMGLPGPTDVITFDHGEILIGAGTAGRHARAYGQPLEHELGLYVIHGLLHLDGLDDTAPAARAAMEKAQQTLFARTIKRLSRT